MGTHGCCGVGTATQGGDNDLQGSYGAGMGTLWGSNGHPWGLWGGDGDPTGQQWAPTDAPHPLSYALWGSEPPLIPLISASDAAERTAERERESQIGFKKAPNG